MEPDTANEAATESLPEDDAPPASDESESGPEQEEKEGEGLGTRAEIEETGPCKRRIKATVPHQSVKERLDRSYQELVSTVQLPGFRRGRVPRRLLEKRYGKEIGKDVQEAILAESYVEAVEEHELKPFGAPAFENQRFDAESDFTWEAEVDVKPAFELPDYKSTEVEVEVAEVADEEVDAELERIRQQHAKLIPVDSDAAGVEDIFVGRYELWSEGNRVKSESEIRFIPQNGTVKSFAVEDLPSLVGEWRERETSPLTLPVKVPPGYSDEVLRDKEVELRFYLEEAKTRELPDLDDEFAKQLGRDDLEAARADVRESMESFNRSRAEKEAEKKIVAKLVGELEIEIPREFVSRFSEEHEHTHAHEHGGEEPAEGEAEKTPTPEGEAASASSPETSEPAPEGEAASASSPETPSAAPEGEAAGASSPETPSAAPEGEAASASSPETPSAAPEGEDGEETEKARQERRDAARRELVEFLLLERICEEEKIFATEDEVRERVSVMARINGLAPRAYQEQLESSGRLGEIRITIRNQKARQFLRKHATIRGLEAGEGPAAKTSAEGSPSQSSEAVNPRSEDVDRTSAPQTPASDASGVTNDASE